MSRIPVAKEINIDEYSDPKFVTVDLFDEGQHIGVNISENIIEAFNLSKTIKFVTYTSCFLSLILCIFNLYFFIPFFITMVGWFGADHYSKGLSIVYTMYLILVTCVRDYVFFYEFLNYEPSNKGDLYFEMIVICINTMVNLWLIVKVIQFINILDTLDDITKERLYNGQIGNVRRVLIE